MNQLIKKILLFNATELEKEMFEAKTLYKQLQHDKIKWCLSCKQPHLAERKICPKCKNNLVSMEDKYKMDEVMRQQEMKRKEQFQQEVNQQVQLQLSGYAGMVECPYCHSKNTRKISTTSKVTSVAMLGIASNKIGKQWHCNNCKSDF